MLTISKEKYFFYSLLVIASLVCLAIFWPFLSIILVSMALAVSVYPFFNWIRRKIAFHNTTAASLITVIIIVICIGVPLYFIGVRVVHEAQGLYNTITSGGTNFSLPFLSQASNLDLQSKVGDIASFISGSLGKVFTSTLNTLLSLLLILLSIFYFLKDGERWKKYAIRISPLSDEHDERIADMLCIAINGVVRGYVIIALLQGLLMALGLWIFGVPNPALWAVLAAITSMIPTIGTSLISIPAIIFLFLTGQTAHAGGLLLWSVLVVGLVDNFLNPLVVGKRLDLPPIVILFAVLGGVALMGPVGLLIGPLAVSLFYTLALIYREDFQSR
jgi:predicted PurR-regulated permease PerM